MVEIDREPGGSTMIRVSTDVRDLIESEKIIPREPLNDCIKRGILENRKFKALLNSLETRERLRVDLEGNTLNHNVPAGTKIVFAPREIWEALHPEYKLNSDDIIHHANGNHNDDSPENLMKVTKTEHREEHKKIDINYRPTKSNDIVGKEQPKLS
jgi:hypothetical protein